MKLNRLALARGACRRARALDERATIAVGLSGGKDSMATLQLVSEVWPSVVCFHLYFVPGLRIIEDHVNAVAARYTKTPVLYLPHPDLSRALRTGIYHGRVDGAQEKGRRLLRMSDIEHTVRTHFNCEWMASGLKALDSLHRRGQLDGKAGVDEKFKRVWPVYDWSDADVVSFNSHHKLPNPPKLGNSKLSGIGLNGPTLYDLKQAAPADYNRIREVFPHVEALILREEMRRKAPPPPKVPRVKKAAESDKPAA